MRTGGAQEARRGTIARRRGLRFGQLQELGAALAHEGQGGFSRPKGVQRLRLLHVRIHADGGVDGPGS